MGDRGYIKREREIDREIEMDEERDRWRIKILFDRGRQELGRRGQRYCWKGRGIEIKGDEEIGKWRDKD